MHDTATKRPAGITAGALTRLIRPKQWIKNGFVLAPLIFTGEFTQRASVIQALNVAYTLVLKHQPVLDIFSIAIGFVLRVWAGAVALDVPVSGWMFVTTLCLALYLAAVKRGQELANSGVHGRKVLERYSKALVDRYAEMSATCALVFYSMFVMSGKPQLVITVPVVLFGLFRYWYVVEMLEGGESPTDALFDDWPLIVTVLAWVGACMWALWPV